jgi:hypothetical protein
MNFIIYRKKGCLVGKNGTFGWIGRCILVVLLPFADHQVALFLQRKLMQINRAMGHTDSNFSLLRTARGNAASQLMRGLGTRTCNVGLYGVMYCLFLAGK